MTHAFHVEDVLTYCLANRFYRNNSQATFFAACESLPFDALAHALSASQLTGLFVSALDELESISPHVAAIKARLQPEMIIRNRFSRSLSDELTRLCTTQPRSAQIIMLGGPDIWSGIYHAPLDRHGEDLDLLFCTEEDFAGCVSAAGNLGYCCMKSDSVSLNYAHANLQRPALSSSLFYVDRDIELNTQEASAFRQLVHNDLNTYSIAEVTPGRFVITHFLELHRLSPAAFASQVGAQCQHYIRKSRLAENLYELDTAAQIVLTTFKYREKIEQSSFSKCAEAKRLKTLGDFIRLIDSAGCEQIVHAKLLAEQCGLSGPLADLLASLLRISPGLPIGALEEIIARPDSSVITQAVASCSRMLAGPLPRMPGPLPMQHEAKVAVS